jgi:hypothetical protein
MASIPEREACPVNPEVGEEEERREQAGGMYLETVALQTRPRRHGGTILATAAPSRD